MNTVRSYFATTVAFLVVAIGWWAADAEICCNSSSVASGGGDVVASCQNKNRMFHMIETFYGVCDDNSTAVSIRKCCPLGQFYDPNLNLCRLAGMDGFEHLQRMINTLYDETQELYTGHIGYIFEKPLCGSGYVLVDLSTEEMHKKVHQHVSTFSEEGCFDLTASKELMARKCQQRDQYCGQVDYTCVHSCCKGDRMIVDGPNVPKCVQNEKQFTMTAYKLDEDGRPSSGSNNRVLPYYLKINSFHEDYKTYHEFRFTTDGRLFLPSNGHFVPYTEYCVGYSQVTDSIVAFIWEADNVFVGTHVRDNSTPLFYQTSYVVSAVCLVLTLFLYNILPSLRKIHNYYVKCYMHHQFMLCICVIYQMSMEQKKKEDTCSLFGYITLFVFLSTLYWLNVICFDIYWKIRYNISSNRNPSTTVRTIMYHFYCWGLSSIFVCTGLFFQYSQDESLQGLAPDFKAYGCFYYKIPGYRGLIFILIPVFVMLTVNLILFWLTAIHSSRIKSELNNFNPTDSKTKSFLVYKEIFVMSIKLCLIMELPYLPTILSYSLHRKWTKRYIIYAASSLQGVLIFIVFVAKHKVIMDLRKKFISSMGYSKPTQIDNISE